ncbi:NAD(P)-dependent alcohol dehydrogenase [Paeniglutamicibacter sp.]|uniref:NAD(P)-dependent alcohol dehydrogenase n=1 Tax=Paeniglutamicibacter sp. TaxID=1934391 RepID=UPI003988F075
MIGRPKPPPLDAAAKIRERARSRTEPAALASEAVPALGIVVAGGPLVPLEIRRRSPGLRDVVIDVQFCGLCDADVHAGRGERGATRLPLVPGHEIVGVVAQTGAGVTDLEPGTRVGVGAMVDSCRACEPCRAGRERFCSKPVATYGAQDPHTGEYTQGGYSKRIVVDRDFVLRIPAALDPAAAAPLLCAGITAYSQLRHHQVGPGSRVGVLGLGGPGQLAVKLAVAMGAEVAVLARGRAERDLAPGLGATTVIDLQDAAALRAANDSLDLVIDTFIAPHEVADYLTCLRRDGALVRLSLPAGALPPVETRLPEPPGPGHAGSLIGSIAETRELLDFCAEHQVACEIELIGAQGINEAWEKILAADVHYGFVLDLATLGGND